MNDVLRKIETIVAKLWDECSIKEYRPIPFWSWNDRLMPEELKRQILWMAQEGFGGYFMHAQAEEPTHVSPRVFELPGSWENGQSRLERKSYSFVRLGLHAPPQMTNGQSG